MCDEAHCATVAAFCSFWLPLQGYCSNLNEILGPLSNFMCVVDHMSDYSQTIFSQDFQYITRYIVFSFNLLILHLLDSFFHFTLQNIRAFSL
jgi:hypothetical protein